VNFVILWVGLATCVSTIAGGALALALKRWTPLILGVSIGAIIGVAVLELVPEAAAAIGTAWTILGMAFGFAAYLAIDRAIQMAAGPASGHRAHLGPASLTAHSFLDGVAIGLAFHASPAIGLSVAIAVIAHDLSDGANTVNLSLTAGSTPGAARLWLAADAAAPVLGILLTWFAPVPQAWLRPVLAALAGGLLYIGLDNLARDGRRIGFWTILRPALGFVFIYVIGRLSRA
jgi:ZIP family zinc transporter